MANKAEKIAALKLEYPTLRRGSDEIGYTEFTPEEYETTIAQWADLQIASEQAEAEKIAAETAIEAKRAASLAKLEALGLDEDDLKALGL